jgi:hypothetical protein
MEIYNTVLSFGIFSLGAFEVHLDIIFLVPCVYFSYFFHNSECALWFSVFPVCFSVGWYWFKPVLMRSLPIASGCVTETQFTG